MLLFATRFNDATFKENQAWRQKNNYQGCIYNSPVKIAINIYPDTQLFILEMNNSKNKIEAIGIIKNHLIFDNHYNYKIYKDNNYNRYIYKGKYRIDRSELSREQEKILNILDILVFKGSQHIKRGQGIKVLPDWIIKNRHFNFINFFKDLFRSRVNSRDNISIERPIQRPILKIIEDQ